MDQNNDPYLVSQHLGTGQVSLLLVDVLHQDTLVLQLSKPFTTHEIIVQLRIWEL